MSAMMSCPVIFRITILLACDPFLPILKQRTIDPQIGQFVSADIVILAVSPVETPKIPARWLRESYLQRSARFYRYT